MKVDLDASINTLSKLSRDELAKLVFSFSLLYVCELYNLKPELRSDDIYDALSLQAEEIERITREGLPLFNSDNENGPCSLDC